MTRKRRRTPSLRPSGLDQLPFLLVMVTLWSWSSVTAAVTASSSFPGRLPTQPQAPPVWYSDGGGSDSDEELESSSDFEEIPLDEGPATTRPMQTLQKLQQLLDETDYRTTTVQKASNPTKTKGTPEVPASAETVLKPSSTTVFSQNETQTPTRVHNATFVPQFSTPYPTKELWTSKDRNRYKRQQYLQRQEAIWSEESDEGDHSDGLSQLPVYMSDDENELDEAKLQKPAPPQKRPQAVERSTQSSRNQPSLSFGHGSTFYQDRMAYPYHQPSELYRGPPPLVNYGVHMPPPWMPRAPPPPPGYYANSGYYSQQSHHHLQHQSPSNIPPLRATAETARNQPPVAATTTEMSVLSTPITSAPPAYQTRKPTLSPMSRLSFGTFQKASILFVGASLASYAAVSPRTLPLTEYNLKFYENLGHVAMTAVVPLLVLLSVSKENDPNKIVSTLFTSSTLGYGLAFAGELLLTTLVRLAVFCWWEPGVFSLTPKVPLPLLPWVLRENGYRPKRISLFAADFGTSCIAAPIMEEYMKLKIVLWTAKLPKNFNWIRHQGKERSEPVPREIGEHDAVSANQHVSHLLAASIGIKLSDATRRVLMYTKASDANKYFYAVCRGLFPIQELCGTMTAISLARKDLLGIKMPLWKMLLPAVVVHGLANFRGMKPLFKWNSSTPWSEMQLWPLHVPDSESLLQVVKKGYKKLMWGIILARVMGYCVKNYMMVNRRALKRTTTYKDNHAGFSAELATQEVLKKS